MHFRRLLCVKIEIDQLYCINCWVKIHCLSVCCTKMNHSCCALMIWSFLQLISKQWIITQQSTARADLFLNYSKFLKLRRPVRAQHRKLENSKCENEMSSDTAYCHCCNALSVSKWTHSWFAHLFSVCVKMQFSLYSFFYKHLFVYSYTAKFVLDLLEIRNARFSHDEAHMLKIIQCNYSYLAWKLLVPVYFYFTRITKFMQVHWTTNETWH